jgi:hypothetical protein
VSETVLWLLTLGLCAILGVGLVQNHSTLTFIRQMSQDRIGAGAGDSGARPVEYWKAEIRGATKEAIQDGMVNVMSAQNELLRGMREDQRRMSDAVVRLVAILEQRTGAGTGGMVTQ